MKIVIVGTGYVGLVSGACFAEMGAEVVCVDIDTQKVESLQKGVVSIFEPGLEELVLRNLEAGRLHFSSDLPTAIEGSEAIFSAVGTPSDEDGSADMQYVEAVARTIGESLTHYAVIVTKSTVPVGSAKRVREIIQQELTRRGAEIEFDVASNPEFLKEGAAIKDFMSPDRVVLGVESVRAEAILRRLYKPFMLNEERFLVTTIPSAEMIKYAANSMLATRISFMNDIANLCEIVGADVNMVRKGIGSDSRIGRKFLYPGCGYGGSCFPKDVKALIKTAQEQGYSMRVLKAVEEVNEKQKEILFEKLYTLLEGEIAGKQIALWGLSFKPDTDDVREAPALRLAERLVEAGARVTAYDPVATGEAKRVLGDRISYARDKYEAALDADALVLTTEWKEFRLPNWELLARTMQGRIVLDGRNIYDHKELKERGFTYQGIGIK